MVRQSSLCAECTQGLQESFAIPKPDKAVYPKYHLVSRNQTVEAFRRAAEDGCFICKTIWYRTAEHSKSWDKGENSAWAGLSYYMWRATSQLKEMIPELVNFDVKYFDPVNQSQGRTTFELVPVPSPQIDEILCPQRLQDSTASNQTLDQALAWYEECTSGHEECEGGRSASTEHEWLPTRLVDVGVEGDKNWRLVLSSEDFMPQHNVCPLYMTLSYRWGSNPRLLLLSSTMGEFRLGKPIDELPQTFKDFVKVARHFNVRYVWIDCICIMQDSIDDWEQEAPMMASVYSSATCNVAADDASGPEKGLFTSREPLDPRDEIVAAVITSTTPNKYYAIVDSHLHFSRQLNPSILKKRGWVFQEWFLSPRVLHFTREEVIWECCNVVMKSETFPFSHQWIQNARSEKSSGNSLRAQRASVPAGAEFAGFMSDEALDVWIRMVARYSECLLTEPKDKPFAFSGIAKHFMGICGDVYYAGMWRTKLAHQLCWRIVTPHPRPNCQYRAPSWSWASVDGLALMDQVEYQEWTYWVEVGDVKVETKTDDCTVGITSGVLRARGCIFGVHYDRYTKKLAGGKHRITFDGKCWLRAELYADTTEVQFGETGYLQLLPLLTHGYIEREGYSDAGWWTGDDPLGAEADGPVDTSTDEESEVRDYESIKHAPLETWVDVVSEDDAMDAQHDVDEGRGDSSMNDDGCLICEVADADFCYWDGKTTCLVLEAAEAPEGFDGKAYRRVGLLQTDSDTCKRHMLQEIMCRSPSEVVLI